MKRSKPTKAIIQSLGNWYKHAVLYQGCYHYNRKGETLLRMVPGYDTQAKCTRCNGTCTVNGPMRQNIMRVMRTESAR
jgi:hypothetical protein